MFTCTCIDALPFFFVSMALGRVLVSLGTLLSRRAAAKTTVAENYTNLLRWHRTSLLQSSIRHMQGTSSSDMDGDEVNIALLNNNSLRDVEEDYEEDPRDVLDNSASDLEGLKELPIMYVRCTFNNTHINICDHTGRILSWKSAGSEGYKNSRKGTTFAAQATGLAAAHKAQELGFRRVRVKLRGPGLGRQHSLKGFELGGLQIASIQDVTPMPHNGCRPPKKRRL